MRLALAVRIAAAELRGGFSGLRIFLLCLAVGVAAIAASGSVSAAFRAGIAAEQRTLLGGDLAVSLEQSRLSEVERAWLDGRGATSELISTRVMGEGTGGVRRFVEVRGVDGAYPLQGAVSLAPAGALAPVLAARDGQWGAAADQALLDALRLKVGDAVTLPSGRTVTVRAVLLRQPDGVGGGFTFAPRMLVSISAFPELGLAQPGSLFSAAVRLKLPPGEDADATARAFGQAFPELKDQVRTRDRAAQGLDEVIPRLELFLSCVGFAALLAGGLGVRGAVSGYLESRRGSIAILKTLGASAADVRLAYGLQIAALAVVGAVLGVAIGAAAPWAVATGYGDALPIPLNVDVYPAPLLAGFAAGLAAAAAFAAGALGAARATPPTALLRGGSGLGAAPWPERLAGVAGLGALVAVFALASPDRVLALTLAGGALAAFGLFRLAGWGAQALARRAKGAGRGAFGLALAAAGGPGSLAPDAAPAIGLGLCLLAALAQIQSNLVTQVRDTAPSRAPSIVFTEIPAARASAFDAELARVAGPLTSERYQRLPILTVRIATLKGAAVDPDKVAESERWILDDEVGATWLAAAPNGVKLAAGRWWPANHAGEQLVSLEADAARGLGLSVGDRIGFELSGQRVDARIASLRTVDWAGFGPSFAVIFSPGPVEAAAARNFAIARLDPAQEEAAATALGRDFAEVGVIRVRDALAAAGDLFEALALAIGAVGAVALVAGAGAIAGALAAGARRRAYDAAVLKALGASRSTILTAFALEQAIVGLMAAVLGVGIGVAAAWAVVVRALEADWAFDAPLIAGLTLGATAAFGLAGLAAGWAALSVPPMRVLAGRGQT
jgi:putative ABC transport system permease protein